MWVLSANTNTYKQIIKICLKYLGVFYLSVKSWLRLEAHCSWIYSYSTYQFSVIFRATDCYIIVVFFSLFSVNSNKSKTNTMIIVFKIKLRGLKIKDKFENINVGRAKVKNLVGYHTVSIQCNLFGNHRLIPSIDCLIMCHSSRV